MRTEQEKIIIDYSHTPDSLEKTLMVIRKITDKKNPVFTVFGCGGNRDKLKRPLMGKIATELSDDVIVTSDNPRNENPSEIIEDIKAGITTDNYKVIEDREKAIEEAIKKSQKNSVILIAGKGHEDYQEIGNVRHHFSDKEIAKNILEFEKVHLNIEDIFNLTSSVIYEPDKLKRIDYVSIDSRKIKKTLYLLH
ncbi:MAG: hypothetical protein M5T52_00270 [Ignavibacteriaceae bacterium]|nr:hypothetical protein [Ignavibacteriaceae bacterium]